MRASAGLLCVLLSCTAEARRDAMQIAGAGAGAAVGSLAGPGGAAAGAAGGFLASGMIAPESATLPPGALGSGGTLEDGMDWTFVLIGLGVAVYMGMREVIALKARDKEQQKELDQLWDALERKQDKT